MIPQIYDGTRVIRRIGEDESIKFQRINDPMNPGSIDLSVGKYDVQLSTGTSYTTRRVEAAQAMMDAIQVWPQLMGVAGDLVAKAQDWPGADKLAERLKKTIPPHFLEDDEKGAGMGVTAEQIQEMQAQLQQLTLENQEFKMDREIDEAKLKIDAYKAQTDRIKALSDHEVDATKVQQDAIKMILEGSKSLDEQDIRREESERNHEIQKSTLAAKSASSSQTKSQ